MSFQPLAKVSLIVAACLISSFALPAFAAQPAYPIVYSMPVAPGCGIDFDKQVLDLTNGYRASLGLPLLRWNERLAKAASMQAAYMATINNITHYGPRGEQIGQRVLEEGYNYIVISENVAAGQRSPQEALYSWQTSSGHDQNLRDPQVTEMGAACVDRPDGRLKVFWAQIFGVE
jgi:uncharacterized protein YkwD